MVLSYFVVMLARFSLSAPISMQQMCLGLGLAFFVMLIGLLGCLLPGVPGTPIVLVAAIAHRLFFGAASADDTVLIILTALTILAQLFDFFVGMLGAKKWARRNAVYGAQFSAEWPASSSDCPA